MKKTILLIICLLSIGGITLSIKSNKTKTLDTTSIAKYKDTMAIYIENKDGGYDKSESIPTSGYVLSNKSKCSNGAKPTYTNNKLKLSNLTKNDTSCYLYFDLSESGKVLNQLGLTSNGEVDSFTGPSCGLTLENCGGSGAYMGTNMKQNGVYQAEDDYGTSYYYRGKVNNNWLKFGKATSGKETGDIWWRIIRINGNGSIRLIYAGTYSSGETPNVQDAKNLIYPTTNSGLIDYPREVEFNETVNDNKYVGYMYNNRPALTTTHDQAHKVDSNSTKSTVLTQIDLWWSQTDLGNLQNTYIDTDIGFCSDTQVNNTTENWWSDDTKTGYGSQKTAYGAYGRMLLNGSWRSEQYPTLKCGVNPKTKMVDTTVQKRDLYTYTDAQPVEIGSEIVEGNKALSIPVGLITADEAVFAGGFGGTYNNDYWLIVGQTYWTISPNRFNDNLPGMFVVGTSGNVGSNTVNSDTIGIRPVINLKSNIKITGHGEAEDPYIVEGAV